MTIYPGIHYFDSFNPMLEFEKWAAMEVSHWEDMPQECESYCLPSGAYAVFDYVGLPSAIGDYYREIFQEWLPASAYILDERPHLARMGAGYKGNHPDSEEHIWIPVKDRSPK